MKVLRWKANEKAVRTMKFRTRTGRGYKEESIAWNNRWHVYAERMQKDEKLDVSALEDNARYSFVSLDMSSKLVLWSSRVDARELTRASHFFVEKSLKEVVLVRSWPVPFPLDQHSLDDLHFCQDDSLRHQSKPKRLFPRRLLAIVLRSNSFDWKRRNTFPFKTDFHDSTNWNDRPQPLHSFGLHPVLVESTPKIVHISRYHSTKKFYQKSLFSYSISNSHNHVQPSSSLIHFSQAAFRPHLFLRRPFHSPTIIHWVGGVPEKRSLWNHPGQIYISDHPTNTCTFTQRPSLHSCYSSLEHRPYESQPFLTPPENKPNQQLSPSIHHATYAVTY